MRRLAALVSILTACGSDLSAGEDCDPAREPRCSHPIDRLVLPRLRALGLGPADAGPDELCRRLAIDLLGRGPTDAERARCRAEGAPGAVAEMLASDDFIRTARRAWAELAHFESTTVWSPDLADLDALAGALYRGDLDYPTFVRRYVVHPAFYGLHPDDSWAAHVFSVFLGRPARQDELDRARPLTLPWVSNAFAGREVFWRRYTAGLAAGEPEATATVAGNSLAYDAARQSWGVNLCRCQPGLLNAGCASDAFGALVRIAPLCTEEPTSPANHHRLLALTPSSDDLCPDGATRRPECADRARGAAPRTFAPLVAWSELSADGQAELAKIGDALLAREDLWEAAADRELRRLLGWWQATFKHPESDLPEVRALLARRLRDGASVREVIALIATSQLYVRPSAPPEGVDPATAPPWVAGPAKLLSGETWFHTAARAVGEAPGACDFRWGQGNRYVPEWVYPQLVASTPSSFEPRMARTADAPHGYTIHAIQRLGGCTGDARRPEVSNIGLAFAQAAIARELCAVATSVTPSGWSGDLRAAARHLGEQVWSRALDDGELAGFADEMQACVAAGPAAGCADAGVAARWLCRRMIDSAQFATY